MFLPSERSDRYDVWSTGRAVSAVCDSLCSGLPFAYYADLYAESLCDLHAVGGQAAKATFLSILCDGLLVVLAIVFAMIWGLEGVFFSAIAADLVAALLTVFVMIRFFAKLPSVMRDQKQVLA